MTAHDPDGDEVRYGMEAPPELSGAAFDGDSGEFAWTPPAGSEGMYRVRFIESDRWDPPASTEGWMWVSVCASPCDDNNFCTDDTCPDDVCQHDFNNTIACRGDPPKECDDLLECTEDGCRDGEPLECTHRLREDRCLIDGACYLWGERHPSDPCLGCQPELATDRWSPVDGNACDDGDNCTFKDICQGGMCGGIPYPCTAGPCVSAAECDGSGLCLLSYHSVGTPCEKPQCLEGVLFGGAECDGAGTCLPFGLSSCRPYACADERACASSCASDEQCQATRTVTAKLSSRACACLTGRRDRAAVAAQRVEAVSVAFCAESRFFWASAGATDPRK